MKYIRRIVLNKFFSDIFFSALYFFASRQNFFALGVVLKIFFIEQIFSKRTGFFYFDRIGLRDDIYQLKNTDPAFFYSAIDRRIFKCIASVFFGPDVNHLNYLWFSKNNARACDKYKKFLCRFLPNVLRSLRVRGIICFNIGGADETLLGEVLRENGFLYICIYKESVSSIGMRRFLREVHFKKRAAFRGSFVFTYNNYIRDTLIESKLVREDLVRAIGCPRLAVSRSAEIKGMSKGHLCWLYAGPKVQLPSLLDPDLDFAWPEIERKQWGLIETLSARFPEIRITVKLKGRDLESAMIHRQNISPCINLVLESDGSLLDHIHQFDCVIGFNSTGLVESFFKGVPAFNLLEIGASMFDDYKLRFGPPLDIDEFSSVLDFLDGSLVYSFDPVSSSRLYEHFGPIDEPVCENLARNIGELVEAL